MEVKICIACLNEKSIESFGKNKNKPGGRNPRCKVCMLNGVKKYREPVLYNPTNHFFRLGNLKKEDYIDTYKFLESMGYDLKSPLSIHEQFCLKYGFEPTKKQVWRDRNFYSIEDLFDFL